MYLGKIKTGQSYKKVIIIFAALSVFLIAAVGYLSFAKATIEVTPKVDEAETQFTTSIQPNPNLDPRKAETITGRIIDASDEGGLEVNQVSTKQIDEYASGTVTLTNTRGQAQPLLATTQLLSSEGVLFRTVSRVVVPAGSSIQADVVSDQPGAAGNIGPSHFTIVKLFQGWQDQIYGDSSEAMTGGVREVQMVTQEDIDAAKNELSEQVYTNATENIRTKLEEGEMILEQALSKEVLEFSSSVEANTEADSFSISMKGRVTAVVFEEGQLLELAKSKLQSEISTDRELSDYRMSDLKYTVGTYDLNNGTAELEVFFKGQTVLKLSNDIFDKSQLFGLRQEEVKQYFDEFQDIENIEVKFSPFWVTTVPAIESKVDIKIVSPPPLEDQQVEDNQ